MVSSLSITVISKTAKNQTAKEKGALPPLDTLPLPGAESPAPEWQPYPYKHPCHGGDV
jgi:hypothetical protein